MGQLPASELDPHIAQEIANSRDHQTHITLEFASHLSALIFAWECSIVASRTSCSLTLTVRSARTCWRSERRLR